jgi:ParB family chromosome partitioning protein
MNDRVDKIVSALSRSDQITLIPVARLRVLVDLHGILTHPTQ